MNTICFADKTIDELMPNGGDDVIDDGQQVVVLPDDWINNSLCRKKASSMVITKFKTRIIQSGLAT